MRVYLDHAATSPLLASARKASELWLDAGNPSSLYFEGQRAKAALDQAREIVSDRLRVQFAEVIFTGSGTEAATLALVGAALAGQAADRKTVVISAAEHHCSIHSAPLLQSLGFEVVFAPVDQFARIDFDALESILRSESVLIVAAMHVNNELGTINEVGLIGELCQKWGALFFCDAVQSFGKIPFAVPDLNADLVSLSGHKIGGPKGVGALYIKAGTPLKPVINGGGQERELRAGTENVAAIAGFGAAAEEIAYDKNFALLKTSLLARLQEMGAQPSTNNETPQLSSHLHVRFPGVTAESLLIALDRVGVSAGSGAACSSGSVEPSHVLTAAGYTAEQAKEGLRFSFGPSTSESDVLIAADKIFSYLNKIGYKFLPGT